MEWNWLTFFISWPICTIFSMFARGMKNDQNIMKYGPRADYRLHPGWAIFGSITGGGLWALAITAVIGLV